jgi:hypothetical protein
VEQAFSKLCSWDFKLAVKVTEENLVKKNTLLSQQIAKMKEDRKNYVIQGPIAPRVADANAVPLITSMLEWLQRRELRKSVYECSYETSPFEEDEECRLRWAIRGWLLNFDDESTPTSDALKKQIPFSQYLPDVLKIFDE